MQKYDNVLSEKLLHLYRTFLFLGYLRILRSLKGMMYDVRMMIKELLIGLI
jgi:hypothetical protein